jgi:hypothetical protein
LETATVKDDVPENGVVRLGQSGPSRSARFQNFWYGWWSRINKCFNAEHNLLFVALAALFAGLFTLLGFLGRFWWVLIFQPLPPAVFPGVDRLHLDICT